MEYVRPRDVARREWKTLQADADELATWVVTEIRRRILNLPEDIARAAVLDALQKQAK